MSRSVFVTGAYGLLGSWLVKGLLDRGARVTVLRRDTVAASALALEGTEARVNVVRGDVCDGALIERLLSQYEVDTVDFAYVYPSVDAWIAINSDCSMMLRTALE